MKKWNGQKSVRENIHDRLPDLVGDFFKEGRKAIQADRSWAEMHEFRLRTKEFRYTLELFEPLYGEALQKRMESIKKIQRFLGDANDAVTTRRLIKGLDGCESLRDKSAKKAEAKLRALRTYWREQFDAAGEQDRWKDYLFRYADPSKESPE
jgi:CHAD domain-containing protein